MTDIQPDENSPAVAKAPKRKRGKERVAQLLEAGAAVFEERGFAAATMTEIAARAGAPIGSLYQFFPNKDVLADALIDRYGEHVFERLDRIAAKAGGLQAAQLAHALLDVFLALSSERRLAIGLLDIRWRGPDARPGYFRGAIRARIAGILRLWRPSLSKDAAESSAIVVLQLMKAHVQLDEDRPGDAKEKAMADWRQMLETYLAGL
jgi:AcrR family transcriptional regulator